MTVVSHLYQLFKSLFGLFLQCKICYTADDNILAVEDSTRRVQEVNEAGVHVRFIGSGVLAGTPRGIAANSEVRYSSADVRLSQTYQLFATIIFDCL